MELKERYIALRTAGFRPERALAVAKNGYKKFMEDPSAECHICGAPREFQHTSFVCWATDRSVCSDCRRI